MALNMKTYKGFNKLPYCEAHIPKAKATTVVETPEMRRLAENTKLQSQVQYHADFEKAKGKFTQVADDPETLRIKANSKIISNVSYHGDLEKKAAMEQKRTLGGDGDEANGHEDSGSVEAVSPEPVAEVIPHQQRSAPHSHSSPPQYHQQTHQHHLQQNNYQSQPQYQQRQPDLNQMKTVSSPSRTVITPNSDSPYSSRQSASSTLVYSSQPHALANQPSRRVGSITDYDPVNENHGSLSQAYTRPQQQPQYNQAQQQQTQQQKLQQYYQQQQRQHAMHVQQQQQAMLEQQQRQHALQQQQTLQQQQASRVSTGGRGGHGGAADTGSAGISSGYHRASGRSFRAMYDYDADDDDEVSFRDGDVIVDCKSIDDGWMMGTVLRTGRSGMVPANYIEQIN